MDANARARPQPAHGRCNWPRPAWGSGEPRQKQFNLGDHRHFGRRRETFKRGCEDGARFGGTAGRSIEFSERKGGEQLVAARALWLRQGDGVFKASSAKAGAGRCRCSKSSPRARWSSHSKAR